MACQRHCEASRDGGTAMSKRPPFDPIQYAQHLKSTGDYAVLNNMLHRWSGQYWSKMDPEDAHRDALRWLAGHSGGALIGARQAKDAVSTALLWVPEFADTERSDLLIPLKN